MTEKKKLSLPCKHIHIFHIHQNSSPHGTNRHKSALPKPPGKRANGIHKNPNELKQNKNKHQIHCQRAFVTIFRSLFCSPVLRAESNIYKIAEHNIADFFFIECLQHIRIDVKTNARFVAAIHICHMPHTPNIYLVKWINRINLNQDLWPLCAGRFFSVTTKRIALISMFNVIANIKFHQKKIKGLSTIVFWCEFLIIPHVYFNTNTKQFKQIKLSE